MSESVYACACPQSLSLSLAAGSEGPTVSQSVCSYARECVCLCVCVSHYCTTLQGAGARTEPSRTGLERAEGQLPVHTTHFTPVSLTHTNTRTQLMQPCCSAQGSHCSSDRRAPVKWLSLPGACVCLCVCVFCSPMWLWGGEGR